MGNDAADMIRRVRLLMGDEPMPREPVFVGDLVQEAVELTRPQ
jgi:hypothetical protein